MCQRLSKAAQALPARNDRKGQTFLNYGRQVVALLVASL